MKAVIELDVPKWQIGQEAHIFFPDTMELWATVKEQEAVKPIRTPETIRAEYNCGNCTSKVGIKFYDGFWYFKSRYCPECGRKVLW